MTISLEEFQAAYDGNKPYVAPSPLTRSDWLSEVLQAEIYLKFENMQPGRSFKIRGATNTLLSQNKQPAQVVTASGGNHGLGVAIAAMRLSIPCLVVLPSTTSPYRVQLLESHGATVELHGEAWDDANKYALNLATDDDTLYIHPFADRSVMIGQGTIVIELEEQLGDFDVFMASVGGGGLLGGNALALEAMNKDCIIYGAETRGADSLAQSLAAGELVELPAITSIANTLGAKKTTPFILSTMQRLLEDCFVVDDADAVEAMFNFLEYEKQLVEPATSCIISAAMQHKNKFKGNKCVFIICGSNLTYQEALQWQQQFSITL